ncbi:hypothetical protein RJ641_018547 [Dillenia turbinata]|uniref:Uncharacterized protein n=1 Tax=Dillenia turbinata TaxID=194707 RepID=A0AAN8UTJ9_9MAGN
MRKVVVEESFPPSSNSDNERRKEARRSRPRHLQMFWRLGSSSLNNLSTLHVCPTHVQEFWMVETSRLFELGRNAWWFDRLLAQHIAIACYIMMITFRDVWRAMHFQLMTNSSKLKEELKKLPAPEVAVKYYTDGDLFGELSYSSSLFFFEMTAAFPIFLHVCSDEFQTSRAPHSRRPKIENVFLNIRDDEAEDCKTMRACQTHGNLRSPHSADASEAESGCAVSQADCTKKVCDKLKKSNIKCTM